MKQSRQGIFYAESWLLTHLLFAGDNPALRQRFGNYTPLLRAGENPVQAFTNAMGLSLPQMEAQLQRYLQNGQFRTDATDVAGAQFPATAICWRAR